MFLQYLDDLLFGESALAHVRLPKERTLPKNGGIYGEQVRGHYKVSSAEAEIIEIEASDSRRSQNTRKLVRMAKCWQRENNAWMLKSFQLERLAIQFLDQWEYSHNDEFYHDWMVRDFFAFLTTQANRWIVMPGNGEVVGLGDDWLTRAQSAHKRAVDACEYERDNYEALAGVEWQKIFGAAVPVTVS